QSAGDEPLGRFEGVYLVGHTHDPIRRENPMRNAPTPPSAPHLSSRPVVQVSVTPHPPRAVELDSPPAPPPTTASESGSRGRRERRRIFGIKLLRSPPVSLSRTTNGRVGVYRITVTDAGSATIR